MKKPHSALAAAAVAFVVIIVVSVAHRLNSKKYPDPILAASSNPVTASTTVNSKPTLGTSTSSDVFAVAMPSLGATIASPVSIKGTANASWFFEGTFPVQLLDSNGDIIAQGPLAAQGDWTAAGPVPFSGSLKFAPQPSGSVGELIFKNDNPSGLPENSKSFIMPITFK